MTYYIRPHWQIGDIFTHRESFPSLSKATQAATMFMEENKVDLKKVEVVNMDGEVVFTTFNNKSER
jgi:hypothetical protein